MSLPSAERKPLVIWRLIDGKRGHENQSLGLVNALAARVPVVAHDVPVYSTIAALVDWLCGRCRLGTTLPAPGLLIAAGHATHLPLLAAQRVRGGRTVVLMKPSLPVAWFDLCLTPRHDGAGESNKVIVTQGALNTIQPSTRLDPARGLFLIGGESRHYIWNTDTLLEQVRAVVDASPDRQWLMADSRRTPAKFSARAASLGLPNLQFVAHATTAPDWLAKQLAVAGTVWVTPDSMSMVYEALTAGGSVGLLDLMPRRQTPLQQEMGRLRNEKRVVTYSDWKRDPARRPQAMPQSEAQRCADLILRRWFA